MILMQTVPTHIEVAKLKKKILEKVNVVSFCCTVIKLVKSSRGRAYVIVFTELIIVISVDCLPVDWLLVWRSGNTVVLINVVTLRWPRLVPGWVIVFRRETTAAQNQKSPRSTQPEPALRG